MKKLNTIFFALLITAVLTGSCTSSMKRNADFLSPLKIEMPDEIKGDKELVEIVELSENAINEFSDNIEQIAVDGKVILNKKDEDLTLMDQMKMAKMAIQFVSNSTQMATALDKFDTYVKSKESQGVINDTQLKALEQVALKFSSRMDEIDAKYQEYYEN
ncbi:MAG: hypothetical protein GQ525_01660 [Draconibacterium sp.]|nr:hypothetical protein [Draconibacterium sp.]